MLGWGEKVVVLKVFSEIIGHDGFHNFRKDWEESYGSIVCRIGSLTTLIDRGDDTLLPERGDSAGL